MSMAADNELGKAWHITHGREWSDPSGLVGAGLRPGRAVWCPNASVSGSMTQAWRQWGPTR
jgi:hypothetical protein